MKTISCALLTACLFVTQFTFSVAQDSLSDPSQAVPMLGEPSVDSLASFRKAVLAQADAAVRDKDLNVRERIRARASAMLLRAATMNTATLSKMHQYAAEQVLADGQAQSYGAIDWAKLKDFIKEILPILLELIKLFTYQPMYQTQNICELTPDGYTHFQLAA